MLFRLFSNFGRTFSVLISFIDLVEILEVERDGLEIVHAQTRFRLSPISVELKNLIEIINQLKWTMCSKICLDKMYVSSIGFVFVEK